MIGNALSVSDFTLTPPIDALKAIVAGTFELTVPDAISLGVPIGLFAMMYPAMTNVRLTEVGRAFGRRGSSRSCWPSTTSSRRS